MPEVLRKYESCDCEYNFALLCIFDPTFLKLSNFNSSLTDALRLAFIKAENQHPGFCEQFIIHLLLRFGISDSLNVPKTYMRIADLANQCSLFSVQSSEIAETTEKFLDSFSTSDEQISNQRILCKLKLEFIQSCRKFSETLKMFHQDKEYVFVMFLA
ncbi:Programmed cell death protein [Schistosoma japonicum]|nr:Programmed cell death protein [Schistosoma japonicum]